MFSGGRERVHCEQMGYGLVDQLQIMKSFAHYVKLVTLNVRRKILLPGTIASNGNRNLLRNILRRRSMKMQLSLKFDNTNIYGFLVTQMAFC